MTGGNKAIVRVNDLVVGVKNDEKTDSKYRLKVNYGTFDINLGDFVLVRGRNGCGKSTFMQIFMVKKDTYFDVINGSITFFEDGFPDESIDKYSVPEGTKLKCAISYIGQEEQFPKEDSSFAYIYNSCKNALKADKSLSKEQRKERVKEAKKTIYGYYEKYLKTSFKFTDYRTFRKKNVHNLSGGQQKMINVLAGLIKAKICGSKLIVMDEPLNNLDGRYKGVLNELIKDIRTNDVAIVAITHCQIFEGINKVLKIDESEEGINRATLSEKEVPPHSECLELCDWKVENI